MRSMGTRITRALVGAVVGLVLLTPAANASCAFMPLEQSLLAAESAFTGTVEGLREPGHVARVRVGRVWKGPDVPERVDVRGGPPAASGAAATSIDFTFARGEEYLFLLQNAEDFSVTQCGGTTSLDGNVQSLEPPDSRPPVGGAAETVVVSALRVPLAWIAASVVLALVAFWVLRRRTALHHH